MGRSGEEEEEERSKNTDINRFQKDCHLTWDALFACTRRAKIKEDFSLSITI